VLDECLDAARLSETPPIQLGDSTVSINFWFEHTLDAYLRACAENRDWREAVEEAERNIGNTPRRVLTQRAFRSKGITYSRQHIDRKVREKTFPPPFQLPNNISKSS
jgi:hypothetical protein